MLTVVSSELRRPREAVVGLGYDHLVGNTDQLMILQPQIWHFFSTAFTCISLS